MTYKTIASIVFYLCLITVFSCKKTSGKTLENTSEIMVSEAKQLIGNEVIFLDVRTPDEIADGKIKNCMTIDFKDAGFEQAILGLDKSKDYIVYCRSGNRSGKAVKFMQQNGFANVRNLIGGYSAWNK